MWKPRIIKTNTGEYKIQFVVEDETGRVIGRDATRSLIFVTGEYSEKQAYDEIREQLVSLAQALNNDIIHEKDT